MAAWSPEGMSQEDFMLKDECIVVNYADEVVGHDNKYNCHKFIPGQPRGILHRAFSVMLFDADGKLLLQQRAASKVTFPQVWTNTCCSHPLHGMQPPELDSLEAMSSGDPVGVKRAAVRKLGHELGIPGSELDVARFKFMTRVHYWAADVQTYGADAPWGEHEIDYLLMYRLAPGEQLTVKPHPEEVKAVKWISREDLRTAMAGGKDALALEMPLWSPWFRVIAERFLDPWWQDLDTALATNKYVDTATIHRFDTRPEYHGGAGGAGPHLDDVAAAETKERKLGNKAQQRAVALAAEHEDHVVGLVGRGMSKVESTAGGIKQGGYGKVPTHSSSKLDQLTRPLEVFAALRFKFGGLLEDNIKKNCDDADVLFCDDMLGKVSRSFAAVIRQLPRGLALDICVFYLVLRALDTVEDDMEAYRGRETEKERELRTFGAKRLTDRDCSIDGVGAADERVLIQQFGKVVRVFETLPAGSQAVIRDITDKMGNGMADYVTADLAQGTVDQAAYDLYCHMVAGLVGEGLTRMFVSRDVESQSLCGQGQHVWPFCPDSQKEPCNYGLANSMGLFLQKTNIIRDYLEDYVDGRAFWPQSVWRKHAITSDLGEFARPTAHGAGKVLPVSSSWGSVAAKGAGVQALQCLNELVADALELVPDSLEYLDRLQNAANYRFCAIPQIMAMATLAECFDNPKLFTGVVKIRKGLTARLICACVDGPDAVHRWFADLAEGISAKAGSGSCTSAGSPLGERVVSACARITERTKARAAAYDARQSQSLWKTLGLAALGIAAAASMMGRRG
mmetsp:Transcript_56695/g.165899  ORF Transcript_56695/g.165899 Transcript_56695/m.165899 type:complete len:793 (-) Transcript_56695:375-2753(-)